MWIEYHLECLDPDGKDTSFQMMLNCDYIVGVSYWDIDNNLNYSAAHGIVLRPGMSNAIHFFRTKDEAMDVYEGFTQAIKGHGYDLMDNLGYIRVIK